MLTLRTAAAALVAAATFGSPVLGQDHFSASAAGLAELNRGNYANAVLLLSTAVRHDPADIETRRNLCKAFVEAGMEKEAIQQLTALIKFGSPSSHDYTLMAQAYGQLGSSKIALCCYKNALQIDSTSTEARIGFARTLMSIGDLRGATAVCTEGLHLTRDPLARQQLHALLGTIRSRANIVRIAANS